MKIQLELKDVNKTFTRPSGEVVHGLEAISLAVPKGAVVGIIGTNGAGKSTLFKAITGQYAIDHGQILLGGQRIDSLDPLKYIHRIGHVFQDPGMGTAPRMTVFENLMLAYKRGQSRLFGRSLTAANRQEMVDLLAGFNLDLEERLDVPIEYLSGGQRQVIALLMATLVTPDLLLLDEHTAALDPRMAQEIMTITQELVRDHQLTTLMISHQLEDTLAYSDLILVMHRGQIAHIYDADQIADLTSYDLFQTMEALTQVDELA